MNFILQEPAANQHKKELPSLPRTIPD